MSCRKGNIPFDRIKKNQKKLSLIEKKNWKNIWFDRKTDRIKRSKNCWFHRIKRMEKHSVYLNKKIETRSVS
jgi:hypothetical protein